MKAFTLGLLMNAGWQRSSSLSQLDWNFSPPFHCTFLLLASSSTSQNGHWAVEGCASLTTGARAKDDSSRSPEHQRSPGPQLEGTCTASPDCCSLAHFHEDRTSHSWMSRCVISMDTLAFIQRRIVTTQEGVVLFFEQLISWPVRKGSVCRGPQWQGES